MASAIVRMKQFSCWRTDSKKAHKDAKVHKKLLLGSVRITRF